MKTNYHIYRCGKGIVEISTDLSKKTLNIKTFDFEGYQLGSKEITLHLDLLADLVDILIDVQNLEVPKETD